MNDENFGRLVWVPEAKNGFILCRICDIGGDKMTVEPINGDSPINANYDEIFPADENQTKDFDDNCSLMYLNEGTLLNNCRLRYQRKQIYSYVANILISINPYEQINDLYSSSMIKNYQGKSIGTMAPHIFAIADNAYREMRRLRRSESIIVSGESGAGKTESQKYILRYLCESWGSTAGPIEQRILETNPILEAFGNAKTLRNNNSSRFGKFVEIHFNKTHSVAGGFISHYLLEKSRICRQLEGERNYHIFYQLIAGANDQIANRLKLKAANNYQYLKHGCTQFFSNSSSSAEISYRRRDSKTNDLHDELLDDFRDFQRLQRALQSVGLTANDQLNVFDVVAAVLHLGNVQFVEKAYDSRDKDGGCIVDEATKKSLQIAATLLGLDDYELSIGLTARIMQTAKGGPKGTLIRVPLKTHEAAAARDALAKAIYSRLFDKIVTCINKCIPFGNSVSYIGVLDIAGFEFFKVNSFEQFCINYCNEKLQNFFNDRILKQEQNLYAREGLNVTRIEYCDNADCIELFEKRVDGLLDLLDEEARLPRPSPQHFTTSAHQQHKDHFRLTTPQKSKLREHRDIRDNEGLLIRHFAGSVCYKTDMFLEKNNDALHGSLEMLMDSSSIEFVRNIFVDNGYENERNNNHKKVQTNKLKFASVSNKFRSQLNRLMKKLEITDTHFVRCIKPNSEMKAGQFEGAMILSQLKCAGMTNVLKLMQKGFPSRTSFAELYKMYQKILPKRLARLDPRLFCKCLFHALGLDDKDFQFGQTKIFFKPGKFAEFDQMLRQDPAQMAILVKRVQLWLIHVRWKKVQYGVLSCIKLKNKILYRARALITIQSTLRGFIARKVYQPKLRLYRNAGILLDRNTELQNIMKHVSSESQQKWSLTVTGIEKTTLELLHSIKRSDVKQFNTLNEQYKSMVNEIDITLVSLRDQLVADEEEEEKKKIKLLEEKQQLEKEKEMQRCLQAKRMDQEHLERLKIEEQRKKDEEEYQQKQKLINKESRKREELERQRTERLAQERLDAELAQRLAQEDTGVQIIDNKVTIKQTKSSSSIKSSSEYNLSQYKYAELRDMINTSTDTDLLIACKKEFHRRLQIYQQWKQRNQSNSEECRTRIPMSMMPIINHNGIIANVEVQQSSIQRYFKVPFAKPSTSHLDMNDLSIVANAHGMWYAHFNGQWIARQMELHPNKKPILLIKGLNDMEMCELSLDATQLTRKKGAEITGTEFETLWQRCGGSPSPHSRRKPV